MVKIDCQADRHTYNQFTWTEVSSMVGEIIRAKVTKSRDNSLECVIS